MPVPHRVAGQTRALRTAARDVGRAVRSEDLARTRDFFREFGRALDAVEGDRLTGHVRMVWNDLEMLLRNDAVEGAQVPWMRDAHRVYESLARDARRLDNGALAAGRGRPRFARTSS